MGVTLDPAVLLQLGLPCLKGSSAIDALPDPSPRTIPAWLCAAGIPEMGLGLASSLTGFGPGLGRFSPASSAHTLALALHVRHCQPDL